MILILGNQTGTYGKKIDLQENVNSGVNSILNTKKRIYDFIFSEKEGGYVFNKTNGIDLLNKGIGIRLNGIEKTFNKKLLKKIDNLLSSENLKGYDCINFARQLSGKNIEIEKKGKNKNLISNFDINDLKIFDVITFTGKEGKLNNNEGNGYTFHFATYIGGGLLIHKPGINCPVIISTIESYINIYEKDYPFLQKVL